MRSPLSSRSSTKPRGSKIRACPHSDLGEFLFWWRNCFWVEFPSVKFLKIWQRSYSLLAFLAFNLSEKFVRQSFRSAQKKKNTKMLKTKNTLTAPTFFDFKSFFLPDYIRFEHIKTFHRRKLKKIEIKGKQTYVKKWRCLSSFNLRLKALISEVTIEQQILALVCYVSVALITKIAKRTRILTFNWGHWRALRDLA